MDCPVWPTWVSVVSNLILWSLIGYWWAAIRRAKRIGRETEQMRAQVAANLLRSEQLLAGLDEFAPWAHLIEKPDPPVSH